MAKSLNLTHYKTVNEFAASIDASASLISKMKREGILPADIFTKSGRQMYVHVAKATAALKKAPVGNRGAAPKWAERVGNKAGIARAKQIAAKKAA